MSFRDRYGTLDRLLHDVAFRAGHAQRALADVEELLYRDRLADVPVDRPVFVTGLPRSGTSILIRLLHESGRFAIHTYRDMPFVMCPVLWSRFAGRFRRGEDRTWERAHGDGLSVSADSPEAFEEMIWKEFWPGHYRGDRILPWRASEENREFSSFLESHIRKLVWLRGDGASGWPRYASKNNLNIARLAAPPPPLEAGVFLVPFRDPVQQAASMLRQHRRFLRIQREDDFVRRYMVAIGHHEFGLGLQPVDFDGWLGEAPAPEDLLFWLHYWIAAYRFVLEHAGQSTHVLSYGELVDRPEHVLSRVADRLGVPAASLAALAGRIRPPRQHDVGEEALDPGVLSEAERIHAELRERSVV